MNLISDLTDRLPSGGEHTRTRMISVLVVSFVLLSAFTGLAAAQDDTTTDFLCGEDGDGDNSTSGFANTIQNLMTVFIVAGPVIGTLVAAYAQVAMAGQPDGDWEKTRKQALISGWGVPVLVYMTEILAGAVLSIDLSCIVP